MVIICEFRSMHTILLTPLNEASDSLMAMCQSMHIQNLAFSAGSHDLDSEMAKAPHIDVSALSWRVKTGQLWKVQPRKQLCVWLSTWESEIYTVIFPCHGVKGICFNRREGQPYNAARYVIIKFIIWCLGLFKVFQKTSKNWPFHIRELRSDGVQDL